MYTHEFGFGIQSGCISIRILTSPPLSCAMAGISELLSAENQASQIVVEARAGGFIITTRLDM